jgi:hypothetical protein
MKDRKYLPTLSELIDRLSIVQLKEVFISDHKAEYAQEIVGGRKDYKIDCLAAEFKDWEISW